MLPRESATKAQMGGRAHELGIEGHEPDLWERLYGWDDQCDLLAALFSAHTGQDCPLRPGATPVQRGTPLIPED